MIDKLTNENQLVVQGGYTTWQFDVRPVKWGTLTLQLCVRVRLPLPNNPNEGIDRPVLEREITVHVSPPRILLHFATSNWQWILTSLGGLAAAIVAWKELFESAGVVYELVTRTP